MGVPWRLYDVYLELFEPVSESCRWVFLGGYTVSVIMMGCLSQWGLQVTVGGLGTGGKINCYVSMVYVYTMKPVSNSHTIEEVKMV